MKAKELESKGTSNCVLIDVRTPIEFETEHIEGAKSIPLDEFTEEKFIEACEGSEGQVVMVCKGGKRAETAKGKLSEDLKKKVNVLEGGMDAWRSAGYDAVEGSSCVLPLERQVFVGAGGLIVLSYLLSYIHPIFSWLSLFVGAGLIYAGLTGKCGMAMLLAKMPWNQCSNKAKKDEEAADCETGG